MWLFIFSSCMLSVPHSSDSLSVMLHSIAKGLSAEHFPSSPSLRPSLTLSLWHGGLFSIKLLPRAPPLLSGLYMHINTETYCSTNTTNSARISECRPPGNIQQVLKWILSSYFTMSPTTVTVRWCFCEDNEEKCQNVQMMEKPFLFLYFGEKYLL